VLSFLNVGVIYEHAYRLFFFFFLWLQRPLRPSTSQSLRMEFLALSPGVHTIEMLTLTDVETGHSITLRYVLTFYEKTYRTNSSNDG
jgi:hypothetical protein